MEEEKLYLLQVRERDETPGIAAQEKGIEEDMRIDIWTIRDEHIVIKDILYSALSEKEKFLMIKRNDAASSTEYIPTIEIKRFKVANV